MVIYEYDIDNNEVIPHEFGDIANLQCFERELNEIYECWFYDENEAIDLVESTKIFLDKLRKIK